MVSPDTLARLLSFNPRSREGNDSDFVMYDARSESFNPRSREGNDNGDPDAYHIDDMVSIHVPAKGTTAITYNFYL